MTTKTEKFEAKKGCRACGAEVTINTLFWSGHCIVCGNEIEHIQVGKVFGDGASRSLESYLKGRIG